MKRKETLINIDILIIILIEAELLVTCGVTGNQQVEKDIQPCSR